jgi:hypothetical protein
MVSASSTTSIVWDSRSSSVSLESRGGNTAALSERASRNGTKLRLLMNVNFLVVGDRHGFSAVNLEKLVVGRYSSQGFDLSPGKHVCRSFKRLVIDKNRERLISMIVWHRVLA